MRFTYKYSKNSLPLGKRLEIDGAASKLAEKLLNIELGSIGLSEYNQRYLGNKIEILRGTLELYTYILSLAVAESHVSYKDFVFVDYGGGSGVLSLLAKELGIGTVIYLDIYDVSCADMRVLTDAVGIGPDCIICGDIEDLQTYVDEKQLLINAIASYDVIEHVYDIENFLQGCAALCTNCCRIVHASGANIRNPMIRKSLAKIHYRTEFLDRTHHWGRKERDSLKSYLSIRKDIIRDGAPELSDDDVDFLAERTRGLNERDVKSVLAEYLQHRRISYRPDHPTNTCDPLTGSWAERLLDMHLLESFLGKSVDEIHIYSGYYSYEPRWFLRVIKYSLNIVISILGRNAISLAPFFVLCAATKSEEKSI